MALISSGIKEEKHYWYLKDITLSLSNLPAHFDKYCLFIRFEMKSYCKIFLNVVKYEYPFVATWNETERKIKNLSLVLNTRLTCEMYENSRRYSQIKSIKVPYYLLSRRECIIINLTCFPMRYNNLTFLKSSRVHLILPMPATITGFCAQSVKINMAFCISMGNVYQSLIHISENTLPNAAINLSPNSQNK